jgi:hypothetical protein
MALLLQLQSIITAHNQWLPKTRSIPYWTTSAFSSTVTDFILIYESVTFSASVVRSTDEYSLLNSLPTDLEDDCLTNAERLNSKSESESASLSCNQAPIWDLRPDFYYCQTVARLLMWGALSDERTGLLFTIAAGPRQRSHSQIRLPQDSWPRFYCLKFETPPTWRARSPYLYHPGTRWPNYNPRHWVPFTSPPTTHRAMVEISDPASTRKLPWTELNSPSYSDYSLQRERAYRTVV